MKPRALLPTLVLLPFAVASCGWNVSRPFERQAPPVKEAVVDLEVGDAASAAGKLEDYLSTGPCKDGSIGTPDALKRRPDGTFDLGVALFRLGEQFGRRFGDEDIDAGVGEASRAQRHAQVECARRVVEAVSDDDHAALDARARSLYLQGNLAFLDGAYEEAVRAYDRALLLAPGTADGGDPVGRDAAWNRAIALERIENEKDAGSDAAPSDSGPGDAAPRASDAGRDGSGPGDHDAGPDHPPDSGSPPPEPPDAGREPPEAGPPPSPPSTNEDERMLDQLESAPTLQQEEAKRLGKRRVRGMADK
jgi:tetratricopeptide (TPR) repeat protein